MGGKWEFYRGSTKVPPRFYQLSSNPGQVGGTCEMHSWPEEVAHRACYSVDLNTHANRHFAGHFVVHTCRCPHVFKVMRDT